MESSKRKKSVEDSDNSEELHNFTEFSVKRVLNDNPQRKCIYLEGTFRGSEQAVVILEKEPFPKENIQRLLLADGRLREQFRNDIYGNFEYSVAPEKNLIKATVICPATEKHIKKYESSAIHIIEETADIYKSCTLPYLQKEQFNIEWVMNILEHKSEKERIVFEDPDPETGFILLPDLKWDGKQVDDLYLIAIVKKRGILSLRDLNGDHLNLLKNVLEKGCAAIEDKYKLSRSRLRVYFHYQPSFYHLHIHFTNVQYDAPGSHCEKAHLLTTVINNIEIDKEYYQKSTLTFSVKESDNLFFQYQKSGLVKSVTWQN